MALILKDRVQETSTTTGTGTLTLAGAVTQFQTFSSAVGNGNTTYYTIYNAGGTQWEVGLGTVGAGTLARTTVLASSNSNALVSFTGTLYVFGDYPAGKSVYVDGNGNVSGYAISGGTINGTAIGGTTAGDGTFDILTGNTSRLGIATGTSFVASNGLSSTSTFTGTTPTDGIVVDYSTGYGRFSAFTGDGYQWYTGGIATTKTMELSSAGALATTGTVTANGVLLTGNLGTVTSVTGTAPVVSSGGTTPAISMAAANTTTNGYLTSTDWNTFNGKGSGSVTSVNLTASTGISVSGGPVTSSGSITVTNTAPMTYPGSGIPNSTGSAWGTSYTTTGTGTVLALATGATFSNASFTGSSSVLAAILTNAAEVCTVSATAATGTIAYYPSTQSVLYYTTSASANWTVNLTFSSGTTMNTAMSTGQSLTVAFLVTQGATAYYNTAVQVDGTTSGVTTIWQGGAPTKGNASGVDVYTYTIIKTGSAAFTVLASQTQFK